MENSFPKYQCEILMHRAIHNVLKDGIYKPENVQEWLSVILSQVLEDLPQISKKYKFCVNGVITQNCGAGLYLISSSRNPILNDNYGFIQYQNGTILCTLIVYGFPI